MTVATQAVLAAGAVCWRVVEGKVQILLVHRGDRADVSLPKGKLDPGETLPQTAVREILEETGLAISLGVPLGTVEYALPSGRDKIVFYWAAKVSKKAFKTSTFKPNSEIAAVEWVTLSSARKALSYKHDIAVIDRFAALLKSGRADTFAIIAVRHGKAIDPGLWSGPDSTRPLTERGDIQALSIAPAIAAFAPSKIVSSTAARCLATVVPLASVTELTVRADAGISQDAFEEGDASIAAVVRKRLSKKKTAVLCSHGPVIPAIIGELARQTDSQPDAALRTAGLLSTAEYTVLHISKDEPTGGIVAVETHGPAVG